MDDGVWALCERIVKSLFICGNIVVCLIKSICSVLLFFPHSIQRTESMYNDYISVVCFCLVSLHLLQGKKTTNNMRVQSNEMSFFSLIPSKYSDNKTIRKKRFFLSKYNFDGYPQIHIHTFKKKKVYCMSG